MSDTILLAPGQAPSPAPGGPPNPLGAAVVFTTLENGQVSVMTAAPTLSVLRPANTPPPQQSTQVVTSVVTSLSTPSPTAAPVVDEGMPFGTKMAAILVPVLVVVALIPIIWLLVVRRRSKKRDSRHSIPEKRPPTETQLLPPRHSPVPSLTLPSPFSDSERIRSGSLGVYDVRQSLEDRARSGSLGIGMYDRPQSGRASSELERGPSPTLPSPSVPAFRPPHSHTASHNTTDSWPLPATGSLPSPNSLYDPHINTNKPLPMPVASSKKSSPQLPQIPNIAPLAVPSSAFRPTSSNYAPTPLSANFPSPPRSAGSATGVPGPIGMNNSSNSLAQSSPHEVLNPFRTTSNRSSAVSELSNYDEQGDDGKL